MNSTSQDIMTLYEVSISLALPEFLIRDFVSYGFNQKKLSVSVVPDNLFDRNEVVSFQNYIEEPWAGVARVEAPQHVKRYLIYEAQGRCAICREKKPNFEFAHIRAWTKSRCNSPHNLLYLCLDCHTSYGNDEKLLQGIKEECLRRLQIIDLSLIYECSSDIITGEAIYALNGTVYRAIASHDDKKLATGFVSTKIGTSKCLIKRNGVISIGNLIPGEAYCLSPYNPGKIIPASTFHEDYKLGKLKSPMYYLIGRAESKSHLVIKFGSFIELKK